MRIVILMGSVMFLQSCIFHYFEKYTRIQIINNSDFTLTEVSLMVRPNETINLASNLNANENSVVTEVEQRGEYPIEIKLEGLSIDTLDAIEVRGGSKRVVIENVKGQWLISN